MIIIIAQFKTTSSEVQVQAMHAGKAGAISVANFSSQVWDY